MSANSIDPRAIQPQTKSYVRQRELLTILPFSAATLWRKTRDGSFPPSVKISKRITVWRRESVEAWLDAKEAA
ncbi:MAG: AlpA family phage regulatory protein [Comamonadaceae bacterium]|nr:MAG: AlpA family phage regulatory protein [Comamonadaceae bacterium]